MVGILEKEEGVFGGWEVWEGILMEMNDQILYLFELLFQTIKE